MRTSAQYLAEDAEFNHSFKDIREEYGLVVALRALLQRLICRYGLHFSECWHCKTYVCGTCFRRVPWEFGAADDMPESCDDCWALAHSSKGA